MRQILPLLALSVLATGCEKYVVRTQSRVTAELTPVNPYAGRVKAVIVQGGVCSGHERFVDKAPRVAIVDVDGLILNTPFSGPLSLGENPVAIFREKLDAIACDPRVKAVVLRVNSPGGGVAACAAMRRDLERFKDCTHLPVVACLMDVAAGGACQLASAADYVVAEAATVTGAYGVILNLFNLRDLMNQFNINPQVVKAGKLVDIGTSARPLTDEERELLQAMADEFQKEIQADVIRSRPGKIDVAGGTTFDGRIFTGTQALARGLVDQIGDLNDAIQLATQMGCAVGKNGITRVVMYRRENDPAHSIYAISANVPLQGAGLLPNLPGLDRAKMPTFLSVWQPELTLEKIGGK